MRGGRIRLGVSSGDFPPNGHRASPCQAQDRWGSSGDTKICKQTKIKFKKKRLFGNEIFKDEFSFVSTASAGPNTVKHNNPGHWKWKWCICAGEGKKRFLHVSQNKCYSISGWWERGSGFQNCPPKELTLIPGQGQLLGRTPPPPLTTFSMNLAIIGEGKRKPHLWFS